MSSSSSSREPSPSMKQTLPNDYGAPIEYFLRAAQWQRAVSPRLGVPPAPVKNSIWSPTRFASYSRSSYDVEKK
ncbi:hypothetical protein TVAG_071490 [Trichomonas vaginalis G3]|uniref:Uncharacterized protein n=1 Tax=Trichomonas vaginalis (strain ATCC PRA-98 / G3) TaxID=412133 RepID=A2D852_TRIV3|nr:hypothetical protein TVAGG3_1046410 [Trichomonas vaginalis G3]EAY23485.1 hypothetical protein TVAG_071490 [Trichomonas vaginalis G3]KAI5493901.1 hypothetical protein TVAGG3_1046410 [Trichomonas vaginalis G3]|eukprot:XP_001584471.1 hypothetical protein [Trichomonas vaginalis G3]